MEGKNAIYTNNLFQWSQKQNGLLSAMSWSFHKPHDDQMKIFKWGYKKLQRSRKTIVFEKRGCFWLRYHNYHAWIV